MLREVLCLKCGRILKTNNKFVFKMCKCENQTHIKGYGENLLFGGYDLDMIVVFEDRK